MQKRLGTYVNVNHVSCLALTLRPRMIFLVSSQVMILITGAHKAFALYKAIEEGVNHMWTVSAFQQHPQTVFVCDEDATLELRVKTVKYFQGVIKSQCLVIINCKYLSKIHK